MFRHQLMRFDLYSKISIGITMNLNYLQYSMIKRQGDYYICDSQIQKSQYDEVKPEQKQRQFISTGNIKERLTMIKQRINTLKTQKKDQPFKFISIPKQHDLPQQNQQDYHIQVEIPGSLLQFEERIQVLEQKIAPNEINRQKVERNATIVERIKRLQKKLEDMVKNKSVEIIANNIMQYGTNIQQKQQSFKQMYLYDIFTKTQGLNEEMLIIERYLERLSKVQRLVNGGIPVPKIVQGHNEILRRREELSARIAKMFGSMKEQYLKVMKEIDAIDI